MTGERYRVEVVAHATLRAQSGGRTLLTDPWLLDPIDGNSGFHFPPVVHSAEQIAAETDAIYISHIHPDHFHRPTLELFDRRIPIYIGAYHRKEFRDAVAALGFPVVEVPFQTPTRIPNTDFEITLVEHDYGETGAFDSALVVRTPDFTLFENNDCFLHSNKYQWVRDNFEIDYAFLGYSPASFFPVCFEMPAEEKAQLLHEASERRYRDFIEAAEILDAKLSIPFASGARFLLESALWKNVGFNSYSEALRRATAIGLPGVVMGPGDQILTDGSLRRVSRVLEADEEFEATAAYGRSVQDWVAKLARLDWPVRDDLAEQFRDYILNRWRQLESRLPGVRRNVIAYSVVGDDETRFYFDFSRPPGEIFQWGEPEQYDMRYRYPASGLQMVLDGTIDWDILHFTNDVSVHQVRYAKDYYILLRSDFLDLAKLAH